MTTQGQNRSPSLAEVIRLAMEHRLQDVHVALPGRIEKYDAASQKADVQPMIQRRVATSEGDEILEALPKLTDVPIVFPRSKEFFVSFPLAAGDYVLLVFNERSLDNFYIGELDEQADPDDFRLHDISSAVAIPGFWPEKGALKEADAANLVVGKDDGGVQIHVTPGDKVEIKLGGGSASQSAAVAEVLETFYNQFKAMYEAHLHGSGMGPTGTPLPPNNPWPSFDQAIKSAKLKLED